MRIRRQSGSSSHVDLDMSQSFLLSRLLVYVDRLLTHALRLDYETLETIHWLLGPEIAEDDLLPLVLMLDGGERPSRYDREDYDIRQSREFANVMDGNLRRARKDLRACVVDLLGGVVKKRLDQLRHRGMSDVEKSLSQFQEMFDLRDLERELCLFLFISEVYEEAQTYFGYHLGCARLKGRNLLATMLDCKGAELAGVIRGKLSKIGILDADSRCLSMNERFVNLLQSSSETEIRTEFFRTFDPDPVPLDAHTASPEVIEHILSLLKEKPLSSTHIIFYGPPGSGKTSMAYGIGKALGLPVYLVEQGGKDKPWERRAAFTACIHMAAQSEDAVLIADDADNILNSRNSWFFRGEPSDKPWLHDLLEVPGVRMIWTVNSVARMEESVARRFAFSLAFKPFNRMQRKRVWQTLLTDYRLDTFLDTHDIDLLAGRFEVSPGVIERSVRNAADMGSNCGAEIYKVMVHSLEAHESLLNGGSTPACESKVDPQSFSLEGLNVSGTNLVTLMKELETFHRYLKHSRHDEPITMSLLFHGVSGAGKSHLARYIAYRLDREILVKRASDLLSKWVGETEHNIRDAFDEAASKEAVLLVDEADSLLGNRDRATHSWEISQANEFLSAMESFRGIQIYTTNRLTDLDPATLRRFSHKVEFHYLKAEGVVTFYRKLLAPLVGNFPSKDLEKALQDIHGLTPGDLRVVRDQFKFKAPEKVSHEALVAALREEARVKPAHAGKKAVGF